MEWIDWYQMDSLENKVESHSPSQRAYSGVWSGSLKTVLSRYLVFLVHRQAGALWSQMQQLT